MDKIEIKGRDIDMMQMACEAANAKAECRAKTKAALRRASKALRSLSCEMDDDPHCSVFGGGTTICVEWFEVADVMLAARGAE
jgi:hypothetical protein